MQKNALKMLDWFSLVTLTSLATISRCHVDVIVEILDGRHASIAPSTIETVLGSNLLLKCSVQGNEQISDPDLVWGRRSKEIRFKNEAELLTLAHENPEHIRDDNGNLLNGTYHSYEALKHFTPLRRTDRGVYFCLSLKYMRTKIIHIKVNEVWAHDNEHSEVHVNSGPCKDFRCVSSGICITSHYMCDGHPDCFDHSDEDWELCGENPCKGKIHCRDGRCIPTSWCCDKRVDVGCTVDIRPSCCPTLPDPYDPILWYYNNNNNNHRNESNVKQLNRGQGSRFLFITICVISAILSFILFLFIISKICGIDTKTRTSTRSRNNHLNHLRRQQRATADVSGSNGGCNHSECSIQREFGRNIWCLYQTAPAAATNANEASDPLITTTAIVTANDNDSTYGRSVLDEPPPYSEVVILPSAIMDKSSLDELFNAPPPPYTHVQFYANENATNGGNDDNAGSIVNQSVRCDNSNSNP